MTHKHIREKCKFYFLDHFINFCLDENNSFIVCSSPLDTQQNQKQPRWKICYLFEETCQDFIIADDGWLYIVTVSNDRADQQKGVT